MRSLIAALMASLLIVTATADVPETTYETISVARPGGELYGTVTIPKKIPDSKATKVPVVLIISGSGPTDRDGNSRLLPGHNNGLKQIAEALTDKGYATVRYDKRGVAASLAAGPKEGDLRFDTYVEDAAAWISLLEQDSRFSSVVVVGHSEGALIGMLAARQTGGVAGFISVAGPARRASDVLRSQLASLPSSIVAANERVLASLEKGIAVQDVPPELNALYRSTVQPYLISWFRYVPRDELARLKMPVLIIHGGTDIQVSESEAVLLKKAKPDAKMVVIAGMNHVLKTVPSDRSRQIESYSDPSLRISADLTTELQKFVQEVTKTTAD